MADSTRAPLLTPGKPKKRRCCTAKDECPELQHGRLRTLARVLCIVLTIVSIISLAPTSIILGIVSYLAATLMSDRFIKASILMKIFVLPWSLANIIVFGFPTLLCTIASWVDLVESTGNPTCHVLSYVLFGFEVAKIAFQLPVGFMLFFLRKRIKAFRAAELVKTGGTETGDDADADTNDTPGT